MWTAAHMKRFVYLLHRWSGIGFSLLMLPWVVSGVVMLFIGYPKLMPQERLQALPALDGAACCVPVDVALSHSRAAAQVQEITLTSVGGQPRYRLREGDGTLLLVDAASGRLLPPADEAAALAGARAFLPGAAATLLGQVEDDRWTHGRALDAHRPLYQVQMDDAQQTLLYVSSRTGEVVLDAPQMQRYWNFVGAWLHWLYMFREGSSDPVWTWLLIVLSAVGTLSVIAGACAGLWRWRFQGRYKSGRHTPYRSLPMRWHHVTGLAFGLMLILWMFSGLMSMNPLGIFNAAHGRPDVAAYRQGLPGAVRPALGTSAALSALHRAGFAASELEWRVLAGEPYLLARSASGDSRLLLRTGSGWAVQTQWPDEPLIAAAAALRPAPIASAETLREHDAYYYERQEASMYAGNVRSLPVLKLSYADEGLTYVYLDPRSGDLVQSVDRTQRVGRWLFNLLHSWDLPAWLKAGMAREAVLILLSVGVLLVAATGIVIAGKRLLLWKRQAG